MKIEVSKKKNMVPFEKIRWGEVFLLSGSYLMKITPIIDEFNNANTRNAVDLRTGATSFVNPRVEYEPVAAILMINPDSPTTMTAVREGSESNA